MDRNSINKGRRQAPSSRVRAIALLISIFCIPAFNTGCSSGTDVPEEQCRYTVILGTSAAEGDGRYPANSQEICHTDIFIFNDDALRRLDSYQRIEGGGPVKAASRRGDKIMVIIANSPLSKTEWRHVNSYEGFMEEMSFLETEIAEYPVMSAVLHISAGSGETYRADLERLVSEVRINSIRTDFSGRGYDGEPLTDVKVYLTNVNASCRMLRHEDFRPEMLINPGFLDMAAISGFRDAGLVFREIDGDIGEDGVYPDISLYCYPNNGMEETAGSPFTALVVEGRIRGNTYWYPIVINRGDFGIASGGDGTGIGRNCRYCYDITIHRAGTKSPDIPVCLEDVSVGCPVEPWNDKNNVTIQF